MIPEYVECCAEGKKRVWKKVQLKALEGEHVTVYQVSGNKRERLIFITCQSIYELRMYHEGASPVHGVVPPWTPQLLQARKLLCSLLQPQQLIKKKDSAGTERGDRTRNQPLLLTACADEKRDGVSRPGRWPVYQLKADGAARVTAMPHRLD